MPIRARKNQYPGVNAHLNSFLQNQEGEWASFHASHIVDLARSLNQYLPEGYEARVEKSLQIRETALDDEGLHTKRRRPEPDVMIVDFDPRRSATGIPVFMASGAAVTSSVIDTMDEDTDTLLNAVIIRNTEEDVLVGKPVTRIELLSPSNKPPMGGYEQYREKRNLTLRSGTPLIEIDYLHQSRPVARNQASYPDHEQESHAYAIVVSDPRPSLTEGLANLYLFDADAPFPRIDVPLEIGEYLEQFDLAEAYNVTFDGTPTYQRVVDYAQLPARFETYTQADQQRIMRRMLLIAEEAREQ